MKKSIAIFAAMALVLVFAGTTVAADWNFYGSARMQTWHHMRSEEVTSVSYTGNTGGAVALMSNASGNASTAAGVTRFSDSDTRWTQPGNARIGANVDAGDVTGRFEYGTGVNTRILWGEWDFGGGKLGVGQHYTPLVWFYSGQAVDFAFGDEGLLGNGLAYTGRDPMIQLKFGSFKLAFVQPVTPAGTAVSNLAAFAATRDTDITLPAIEASYGFSTDMFFFDIGGGYQSVDFVNTATDNSKSLTSYGFALGGGVNFGPGSFKAQINYDQNGAGAGWNRYAGRPANVAGTVYPFTVVYDTGKGDFADVTTMGLVGVFNWTFSDMVGLEVGAGYMNFDNDLSTTMGGKIENSVYSFYVNAPITLADGVSVIPEIGMLNWGDYEVKAPTSAKADLGNHTYFGAFWRIDF